MRNVILLALILGLAGCSLVRNTTGSLGFGGGRDARKSRVETGGVRFQARATPSSEDKRDITVTVTPVAVNPEAALEAARYQATRYCLLSFGGSDTAWTIGPDQPLDSLLIVDDTLSFQGRCTQR